MSWKAIIVIGLAVIFVMAALFLWGCCIINARCEEREREYWDVLHGTIPPK